MVSLQEQFREIVFEFTKRVSSIPKIYSVLLFGSVAKGEADARSDIDFLIVFDTQQDPDSLEERNKVSTIALDLEKAFSRNIQLVFSNVRFDRLDGQFIEDVMGEGIIVFGRPLTMIDGRLGFSPYMLIHYELARLSPSEKMKVKRALYGYRTGKPYKGKMYTSKMKGLVEELDGKRTGIASILLPYRKSRPILETLEGFDAKISKEMVWISETRSETQFDLERFASNISILKGIQDGDTKEKILEAIRHQATGLPYDGMSDSIRNCVTTLLRDLQNECKNETRRKRCLDILSLISKRRDEKVNARMKDLFLNRICRIYSALSIEEKSDALDVIQRLQRYDPKIIHQLVVDAIESWTQIEFQNLLNSIEFSSLDKEEIERLRKRLWNWRASEMKNQDREKVDRIDRILELYVFH